MNNKEIDSTSLKVLKSNSKLTLNRLNDIMDFYSLETGNF